MEKIENISYNISDYDSTYGNTRLEINIKGENINCIILNTLRRAILSYIPNYAFTNFNFKKNNTVFNNNYIKLRVSNIPVWGIENELDYYNPVKKNLNTEPINEDDNLNDDIDLNSEVNNVLNSSTLKQLTMYVDYTSLDSDEITTVTTDHAKFYYEEKKIDSPYKIPIPIIKLQSNQTITFSVITTVGTELQNSIFAPVSVCFYKEINLTEYTFILESRGTINEKRIIYVALLNIINKLRNVIKNLPDKIDDKLKGELIILNEDATLGNLISYGLQIHKDIKFAGFNIPHPLEERVKIHYELIKNNITNVLSDVVNHFIKLYEKIIEKNNKINL